MNNPEKMRAGRDPAALELQKRFKIRMPSQDLNVDEMAALLKYLATATSSPATAGSGDAAKLSAVSH